MMWGLILSCFFCNRVQDDGWGETGWWGETGRWDDTEVDCAPWISVRDGDDKAVDTLDFGTVANADPVTLELLVTNKGECDLVIDGMSVDGEGFTASTLDSPIIEPDAAEALLVTFVAESAGQSVGSLTILSNDPFDTEYIIDLTGALANGTITSDVSALDFGEVAVGCEVELGATIGNTGPGPIEIIEVSSDVTDFEVGSDGLPKSIEADQDLSVLVRYAPEAEGEHAGTVTILSSDASEPELAIAVTGTAVYSDWNTEDFTGNGSNRVFILDSVAVDGTVEVRVSGVLAAGWNFDSSANAVVFDDGNAPAEGAAISATYATQPVCD